MEIVRQQWKELGHFGNPRSNEMKRCTITFKFDFLRRKSPSLISARIIHIGYEQRGAK